MGVGIEKLYLTNLGEDEPQYLSDYKPVMNDDGEWVRPKGCCLGMEMFVPVIFSDLKKEDEPCEVRVVASDKETGLYLYCKNGYFGNEQYICNYKIARNDDTETKEYNPFIIACHSDELDEKITQELGYEPWQIHVICNDHADMVHGDGPYNVTLERI